MKKIEWNKITEKFDLLKNNYIDFLIYDKKEVIISNKEKMGIYNDTYMFITKNKNYKERLTNIYWYFENNIHLFFELISKFEIKNLEIFIEIYNKILLFIKFNNTCFSVLNTVHLDQNLSTHKIILKFLKLFFEKHVLLIIDEFNDNIFEEKININKLMINNIIINLIYVLSYDNDCKLVYEDNILKFKIIKNKMLNLTYIDNKFKNKFLNKVKGIIENYYNLKIVENPYDSLDEIYNLEVNYFDKIKNYFYFYKEQIDELIYKQFFFEKFKIMLNENNINNFLDTDKNLNKIKIIIYYCIKDNIFVSYLKVLINNFIIITINKIKSSFNLNEWLKTMVDIKFFDLKLIKFINECIDVKLKFTYYINIMIQKEFNDFEYINKIINNYINKFLLNINKFSDIEIEKELVFIERLLNYINNRELFLENYKYYLVKRSINTFNFYKNIEIQILNYFEKFFGNLSVRTIKEIMNDIINEVNLENSKFSLKLISRPNFPQIILNNNLNKKIDLKDKLLDNIYSSAVNKIKKNLNKKIDLLPYEGCIKFKFNKKI